MRELLRVCTPYGGYPTVLTQAGRTRVGLMIVGLCYRMLRAQLVGHGLSPSVLIEEVKKEVLAR